MIWRTLGGPIGAGAEACAKADVALGRIRANAHNRKRVFFIIAHLRGALERVGCKNIGSDCQFCVFLSELEKSGIRLPPGSMRARVYYAPPRGQLSFPQVLRAGALPPAAEELRRSG